jgi:hypothetical protein
MTATVPSRTTPSTAARPARRRALAVAGAVLAPVLVWAVAVLLLGVPLAAHQGAPEPIPVGPVAVAGAALLASLAGWGLLALLERVTARGTRIWTVVAVVVAVLSLAAPLTSGATPAAGVVLALMHVAVAAVLVPGLRR